MKNLILYGVTSLAIFAMNAMAQSTSVGTIPGTPDFPGIGVDAVRAGMEDAHESLFGNAVDADSIVLELGTEASSPGTYFGQNQFGQAFTLTIDHAITADISSLQETDPVAHQQITAHQYKETRVRGHISTSLATMPIVGHTIDWIGPRNNLESYFILAGDPALYWILDADELIEVAGLVLPQLAQAGTNPSPSDIPGHLATLDDDVTHHIDIHCFTSEWVEVADDPICDLIMELFEELMDQLAADVSEAKAAIVEAHSNALDAAMSSFLEALTGATGGYHSILNGDLPSGHYGGPPGGPGTSFSPPTSSGSAAPRYNQDTQTQQMLVSNGEDLLEALESDLQSANAQREADMDLVDDLAEAAAGALEEERDDALEAFGCQPLTCTATTCMVTYYGVDGDGGVVYSFTIVSYTEICE